MRHLSVTQHGTGLWGLYVVAEGICGDTVLRIPTVKGSDIHPERHISAGIVLPSTSASFCLNFCVFWKNKIFSKSSHYHLGM